MGGDGVRFAFFAGASGVALIATETAYVYDKSWATYQACQAFIIIEYASLAFTLCGQCLHDNAATRVLWKNLELVAAVLGVFASAKTGYALSACVLDDDVLSERGEARDCLDVYDSYAALDGPFGASSVCASLNKNIESPLGGTCPTITYSDEAAGKAVLGLQFGVIVVLTVLHFYKFMTIGLNARGDDSAESGFPAKAAPIFEFGLAPSPSVEAPKAPARSQMTRTAFSARPFKTTSVYSLNSKKS